MSKYAMYVIMSSVYIMTLLLNPFTNTILATTLSKVPKIWNIPLANDYFTGRHGYFDQINNAINNGNKVIVLSGPGGIGKTQIVKKYAENYAERYDIIRWFDANENLEEQFYEFALEWNRVNPGNLIAYLDELSEEAVVTKLKEALRVTNLNWLLIFDNAINKDHIKHFFPETHSNLNKNIIATSRDHFSWDKIIEVIPFDREESTEFLGKVFNNTDPNFKQRIIELVGDYPLALAQSASYLKLNHSITMDDYEKLFMQKRRELWKAENNVKDTIEESLPAYDNYKYTTSTVFNLSFNQYSHPAFSILAISSLLDNQNIPEILLKSWFIENISNNELEFSQYILSLGKHSLVIVKQDKNSENKVYFVHDVIRYSLNDFLTNRQKKEYINSLARSVNHILPNSTTDLNQYLDSNPTIINNIEVLLKVSKENNIKSEDLFALHAKLLDYYLFGRKDYQNVKRLLDQAESLLSHVTTYNKLIIAKYYTVKGSYLGTKDSAKAIHAIEHNVLESLGTTEINPEELFKAYTQLTHFYLFQGNLNKALHYLECAKEIIDKEQSVSNKDLYFHALARYSQDKGNLDKAYSYSKKALSEALSVKVKGSLARTMSIYMMEAKLLLRMDRYQESYKLSYELYNKAKDYFQTEDHLIIARILMVLSSAANKLNMNDMAEIYILRSLAVYNKFYEVNTNNRYLAIAHTVLGDIYYSKRQLL